MAATRTKKRVLLVGWDAADWKFINPLLDSGRMPNLSKLVDQGVIGNLASLKPCLSPLLWTSIATGKTADKHGILGFVEPLPGGVGVQLSASTSRQTKAIWNILDQSRMTSIVVNWFASHPAEPVAGCIVSNRFFEAPPVDVVSDWRVPVESVHSVGQSHDLAPLRFHPRELTLSDIARFIPDIEGIDPTVDPRPNDLVRELAKTISVHAVATHALESFDWDFAAILYDGIDTLGHHFMPFHPPRMNGVPEADFQKYQNVMTEVYLFHDEMLGRLLELAGDETTVILISDHGFHSDHQRPLHLSVDAPEEEVAAAWHRPLGVFAMRGPGVLQDERVYGATLLDITPTILQIFQLPIGQDMDGKPLLQAFANSNQPIQAVRTWESESSGPNSSPRGPIEEISLEAIQQLINLGYLPKSAIDQATANHIATAEWKFNRAIVLASVGKHEAAQQQLDELCNQFPNQPRYLFALAKTHANLRQHQDCLKLVQALESLGHSSLELSLLAVAEFFNHGNVEEAKKRLDEANKRYPPNPILYGLTGNIMLQQRNWQAALESYLKAIEMNDEDAQLHFQAAYAANKLNQHTVGADHALKAISLLFFFPQAHFQLALAFEGLGDFPRAIRSYELATTQAPKFLEAHQKLADLYKLQNNLPLWVKHQNLAQGGIDVGV